MIQGAGLDILLMRADRFAPICLGFLQVVNRLKPNGVGIIPML
jgi:hypothetical protein